MNWERRKLLKEVITKLGDLELSDSEVDLSSLKADVEQALEEEQEYFDVMPPGFQQGEKGQRAEEAIQSLESAVSDLERLAEVWEDYSIESRREDIDEIIGEIEEAL